MAQIIEQEVIVNGSLIKSENSLTFSGAGVQIMLLPFVLKKVAHLPFESTPANLKFKASFVTKYVDDKYVVNMKKAKDFDAKDFSIDLPDLNFVLENCNLFTPQSESLTEFTEAAMNEALQLGRFNDILEQEDSPYSLEEDKLALEIYLTTKDHTYGEMLDLISEKIKSGEFKRSKDSVEMRVNSYKQLDSDSSLKGLTPKDQSVKVWEEYKNQK